MEDLIEKIAFGTYKNINLGAAKHFQALGIDAKAFFSKSAIELSTISGIKPAFYDDSKRHAALEAARQEVEFIQSKGLNICYFADDDYPCRLQECEDAPAILFSYGKPEARPAHVVAIVGTRHCTTYGIDFTTRLVRELAENVEGGVLIISGLAYGIDIAAHRAALANGLTTGAVLAHGLNTIYPADHRNEARRIVAEGGFMLTEYTTKMPIHRGNFLARNRIVAALSDVTVVVESDIKGGAMSTARLAGAYNREVMALPGRVTDTYSRGCNALIARSEAMMIRDAGDIIENLGWPVKAKEGTQQQLHFLTPEQQQIVDYLRNKPDATVNDICASTGLPYAKLTTMLFELEMDDVLVALPGNRYNLLQ